MWRPAQPVVSSQPRPPSRAWVARDRPSPFPPGLRRSRLTRKRPPARPAAGRSGRGRSPPPAGSLTSSSGSSSSFSRNRSRHSRRKRHFRSSRPISSALRCGRGRKGRPSREKAGRQKGGPAHSGPPCESETVGCQLRTRAATLVSGGLRPGPQLQVAGDVGTRRISLPDPLAWAFQSVPTFPVGTREGLWGPGIDTCPRWVSGPPPVAPAGLTGGGRALGSQRAGPPGGA